MKRTISVWGACGLSVLLMTSICWKTAGAIGNQNRFNLTDYSNINQAVAAAVAAGGGTIDIPAGVHTFNKTLTIGDGKNIVPIRMIGNGGRAFWEAQPKGSVLRYTARDGSPAIKINTSQFLELSGFALSGGSAAETGQGVAGTGKLLGNGRGIDATGMSSSIFSRLEISGFDRQGIYLENSYANLVQSCVIQGCDIGYEGNGDNVTTLDHCYINYCGDGARNIGRALGTLFESNYRNGLLLDVAYARTSCQDCYFENNGRKDDREYADIWGGDPNAVVALSGLTNLQGSGQIRTNRMTHLGGGFLWVQVEGVIGVALYPKDKAGACWEFGSLSNGTTVLDNNPFSSLRSSAWGNKPVFKP